MKMNSAKRLVSKYLNVGTSRVKVDPEKAKAIKDAITGEDLKALIKDGVFEKAGVGHSRGRARILALKKKAGRKRGQGTRRGLASARTNPKQLWLKKVRSQRVYLKKLLDENKVDKPKYRELYRKIKGGFFRSKAHIDVYISK